jgi:uncharacterized protein YybS (DUF2232 family)
VNPIADKTISETIAAYGRVASKPRVPYPIVGAMLLYSVLQFGHWGERMGGAVVFLFAVITYFLVIYLYYGIAQLAYTQCTLPLWGGLTAALILPFLFFGTSEVWTLLTGWGMLLSAGVLTGRLSLANYKQGRIYIIGATAVTVFFALQSLPMWSEFIKSAPEIGDSFIRQSEQFLLGIGYSPEMIGENLAYTRKLFDVMVRLFPALTVLGALLQFSAGYLVFVSRVSRQAWPSVRLPPFIYWKVPFGFTPLLIIMILVRFWGGEMLKMSADNVLVVMAVYYCIAGLALMEYYLRKLHLSRLMRVFFYVLLFLTQLAGFFVAVLVGFIDSFADWRKIRTREVT